MTPPETVAPAPLKVAALLCGLQGATLAGYAALESLAITRSRLAMGIGTALFFALVAAALVGCAWALMRGRSWARSPLVLAQLIGLGLAWSFRGGDTTWVAIALAIVALGVLVGILHPASIAWLSRDDA